MWEKAVESPIEHTRGNERIDVADGKAADIISINFNLGMTRLTDADPL